MGTSVGAQTRYLGYPASRGLSKPSVTPSLCRKPQIIPAIRRDFLDQCGILHSMGGPHKAKSLICVL